MPVRITDKLGETDPRAISAAQLSVGRIDFNQHYCKASLPIPEVLPSPQFGLTGQTNKISWADFAATIEEYRTAYPHIHQEDIALRFVHCYDDMSSSLYQRMQICAMGPVEEVDDRRERQLITEECLWYTIKDGIIEPTDDDTLEDQMYVNSLMYKPMPAGAIAQLLEQYPDKFVTNLTFPWLSEVYAMYFENQQPAGADINFTAYTSLMESASGGANVLYPHGMVIFLSVGEEELVNNEHYACVFHNRGADNATLCPPMCGIYVIPQQHHII